MNYFLCHPCAGSALSCFLLSLHACGAGHYPSTEPVVTEQSAASAPTVSRSPARPASAPPAKATVPSDTLLTIATWNIEHLRAENGVGPVKRDDADFARLRRYAERLNAGVVAVQEVDSPAALSRVFDPSVYDFHMSSRNNTQRTGFAFRKGLRIEKNPDYEALDVGGVRHGTDLTVYLGATPVRMLSVHLKSGCFDAQLSSDQPACRKLKQQVPLLERWIDARAEEGVAFVVLGDFNRRLFKAGGRGDDFWQEIDDGVPTGAHLSSLTMGQRSQCWGGKFPDYIDHIILGVSAAELAVPGSFQQRIYDESEDARGLSDHCPIAATLATHLPAADPEDREPTPSLGAVKGNVGRRGLRLYHIPGCPNYHRVKIDPLKGEGLFDSEVSALAAGFAKSPDCP